MSDEQIKELATPFMQADISTKKIWWHWPVYELDRTFNKIAWYTA